MSTCWDGYLATNRQCDVVTEEPVKCVSTNFIASALTGHPTLIEGFSYAIMDMPPWAIRRSLSSYDFALAPTQELTDYLVDEGVRWVWIDHMVPSARAWPHYGRLRYRNPTVSIVELDP